MSIITIILMYICFFAFIKASNYSPSRFLIEDPDSNDETPLELNFLELSTFEQIWNEYSPDDIFPSVALASASTPVEEEDEYTFSDLESEYELGEDIEDWGFETIDCGIEPDPAFSEEQGTCRTMKHCILVNIPRLGWKRIYRTEVIC